MILVKRACKKDKALLIEFKLATITPYIKNSNENLNVIKYVNEFISENYMKGFLVYNNFKLIGAYLINNSILDLFFIKEKYRSLGFGHKIIKKIGNDFDQVWVMKNNAKAIKFYFKFDFIIIKEEKNRLLLRKG